MAASQDLTNYHCICSQFILLSTQPLEDYRQRDGDALDKAYILPVAKPTSSSNDASSANSQDLSNDQALEEILQTNSSSTQASGKASSLSVNHYAILHTPSLTPKSHAGKAPLIVMRSDGFEPRYQVKCARCNLIIGYHLDKSLYSKDAQLQSSGRPREDVLYIIPGSLETIK